jgi:selenocysteine lyase/cysteine desulfurase
MLNITQLRKDTPGTQNYNHLNNAGAALMPAPVMEAIRKYQDLEYGIGGYEAMAREADSFKSFYNEGAKLLHAKAENIAWAGSATDAYNKALSSFPLLPGDYLLTTINDYVANQVAFLHLQKRRGIKLLRADDLPEGGVDVNSVEKLIKTYRPKVVAVTHVPTNSGLIQPIDVIGELCKKYSCWYLVDACQSAGQLPLDVQKTGCDYLSLTMRKFVRGPRGGGLLFASDRVIEKGLEPAYPDGFGATWTEADDYQPDHTAKRFEYFERNYSLLLGSAAAMKYANDLGLDKIQKRVQKLSDSLRAKLNGEKGWKVMDQGKELAGIVTLFHPDLEGSAVHSQLQSKGINSSVAGVYNAVIDMHNKGIFWALRLSPHYYNTEDEIDQAADVLLKMVKN